MNDIKFTSGGEGISIFHYATDRFKSENISVYFSVPASKEESVKRSLLLSVLKRGTEKYPTQKHINERLDELYATLFNLKNQKFDSCQLLGVSADIINSAYTENGEDLLPEVLEVMAQMLLKPRLDADGGIFLDEYVQSEKENYKSIVLSQINEPRTYAAIRCREEMFESLGIYDSLDVICEKIDAATSRDVYETYLDVLKSAKMIVFYIGLRSQEEIREHVLSAFASREAVRSHSNAAALPALAQLECARVVTEDSALSQGRLLIGLNSDVTWRDDEYYAMLLCNEILGASPISKLMMNVREERSLCYECSSVYNSARGAIIVSTGIDSSNYELAREVILEQLCDIQNGRISETEFSSAKKSIYNVYSAVADSPNAIERFYLGRIINGIDMDVEGFLSRIDALTVEDVVAVSKRLLPHTVYFLRGDALGEGVADE